MANEIAQQRIAKWIAVCNSERVLDLSNLGLTSLPPLPLGLQKLICSYNKLTSLRELPEGLQILNCPTIN